MSKEELRTLIESIGFKNFVNNDYYVYEDFGIDLHNAYYNFYIGSEWVYDIRYDDLKPLEKYFKKYFRSIKLKQLLK